jgi:hypothetical protein
LDSDDYCNRAFTRIALGDQGPNVHWTYSVATGREAVIAGSRIVKVSPQSGSHDDISNGRVVAGNYLISLRKAVAPLKMPNLTLANLAASAYR